MSRCPRSECNGTSFRMKEFSPEVRGSAVRLQSIECDTCGAVVGVYDVVSVPKLIYALATALNIRLE
jgi:hypothetical protein